VLAELVEDVGLVGVRIRNLVDAGVGAVRALRRRQTRRNGSDPGVALIGDVEGGVGGDGDGGDGAEDDLGGQVVIGLEATARGVQAVAGRVLAGHRNQPAVRRDFPDPVDPLRIAFRHKQVTVGSEGDGLRTGQTGHCGHHDHAAVIIGSSVISGRGAVEGATGDDLDLTVLGDLEHDVVVDDVEGSV